MVLSPSLKIVAGTVTGVAHQVDEIVVCVLELIPQLCDIGVELSANSLELGCSPRRLALAVRHHGRC